MNLSRATATHYLASDADSYVGSNELHYRNLRLKLFHDPEFDGIRKGPPKSESVAGDFYLAPDAKVSFVWSNGLHHRNLRL